MIPKNKHLHTENFNPWVHIWVKKKKKKRHFQATLHENPRGIHYRGKWQICVAVMLHSLYTINGLFITNGNEVICFIWEGGNFSIRKTWIVVPSSAAGLEGEWGQVILLCDAFVSASKKLWDGYCSFVKHSEIWCPRSQVVLLILKGFKFVCTSGACV